MRYREDIDGLRSIAILPIVLFHAGADRLAGGFVGVDVFFVISGYLITRLIDKDLEKGIFGYGRFAIRRIRRLFPALVVAILGTFIASYFVLFPTHFEDAAESSLAALFSFSNFYFWQQTGYFDKDALVKPLLHTWSLAVEEQFYLVWPTLMLVLHRTASRKWQLGWIVALGLASLLAAEYYLRRDPSAAFYLAPFRVTEFAIGGFLALSRANAPNAAVAHGVSVAGLLGILVSVFTYREQTPFPGLTALVPCLGTGLLIYAGPTGIVNRALALNPFRYIGQISYSLYLVHWPVVVFWAYRHGLQGGFEEVIGLTAVSMVLGALMYHLVEVPFRRKSHEQFVVTNRQLVATALGATVVSTAVLGASARSILRQPVPSDLAPVVEQVRTGRADNDRLVRYQLCHASSKSPAKYVEAWTAHCLPHGVGQHIAVLGDSHAADLWGGLNRVFPGVEIYQLTGGGCGWVTTAKVTTLCRFLKDRQRTWVKANAGRVSSVIYTQRGHLFLRKTKAGVFEPDKDRIKKLKDLLERFAKETGVKVIYWGPRPEFHPGIERIAMQAATLEQLRALGAGVDMRPYLALDTALSAAFAGSQITYVSTMQALCDEAGCPMLTDDGKSTIWDFAHWTAEGAEFVVKKVVDRSGLRDLIAAPSAAAGR